MKCSRCGNTTLSRSRRERWQKHLAWIVPLRPYRCNQCNERLWRPLNWQHHRPRYATAGLFAAGSLMLLAYCLISPGQESDQSATQSAWTADGIPAPEAKKQPVTDVGDSTQAPAGQPPEDAPEKVPDRDPSAGKSEENYLNSDSGLRFSPPD